MAMNVNGFHQAINSPGKQLRKGEIRDETTPMHLERMLEKRLRLVDQADLLNLSPVF